MAVTTKVDKFGELKLSDGNVKDILRFTLSNGNIEVQLINYGATITSIRVPNKSGQLEDIVMGFDNISDYVSHPYYFGCTIGRCANRIARGSFVLQNKVHNLAVNNGPNHLHGGLTGFDKVIWNHEIQDGRVKFSYTSPSMEENYPGDLNCDVTFELTDGDDLIIEYKATSNQATPVNLTNHSYFNLAGHGSGRIHDHIISINADYYTPVDESSIPTGNINSVISTCFDLREPKKIGSLLDIIPSGYDHNFCINGDSGIERKVASLHDPESGRYMEIYSTQPGVQFYTANFLPENDTLCGKDKKCYRKQGGLCLETQNYPDAINQVNFPKAFIDVGEVYHHTTKFSFSVQ